MRALLLGLALLALPAALAAQGPGYVPPYAPTALDLLLKTGFKRYLAARQANPAAAELFEFWESRPGLEFKTHSEDIGSWARYDSAAGVIEISGSLLDVCGIEQSARNVTPESLAKFLRLSAPTLVHESVHARTHAELGFIARGVFEDELLSFAYEAWFMDGDPDFANREAYELGKARLDEYTPVYQRWKKADNALNEARREVGTAGDARDKARLKRARSLMERRQRAAEAAAAEAHQAETPPPGYHRYQVQTFQEWVAFTRGWKDLVKLAAGYHQKHSVFDTDEGAADYAVELRSQIALHTRYAREAHAQGKDPSEHLALVDMMGEAAAFWEDPARLERARAYYSQRLERVAPFGGRGFPPRPAPADEPRRLGN